MLGSLLLDPARIDQVSGQLQTEDFGLPAHGRIYAAMLGIQARAGAIDSITLAAELERRGELKSIGGRPRLAQLQEGVPTARNLEHYAEIVHDLAARRRLATQLDCLAVAANDPSTPLADIERRAREVSDAVTSPIGPSERKLRFLTALELAAEADSKVEWVVRGLAARGGITELAGPPKTSGKTTFCLRLARSVIEGHPFLGLETRKGPVVYLTEERRPSFLAALGRAGLAGNRDLHVLTFSRSHGIAWPQVVAAAIALAEKVGACLLVVDTLHRWAGISGDSENESGAAVVAMQPLHAAAAAGLAVIADRHERKSGGEVGQAARGSSAYTGEVDIAGSLRRWPGGRPNLRELQMVGRFDDVPERLLFELDSLSGTYRLADGAEVERERLLGVIPGSEAEAATEPEISQRLGRTRATVRDHLSALLEAGAIHRAGGGKRGDPYRYWRPQKLSDGPIGKVTASETQPLPLAAQPVQPNGKHPVGVSR